LSQLQTPDGTPVIGTPLRILDYSQITACFPFSLDTFLVSPLRELFSRIISEKGESTKITLSPTFVFQVHPHGQETPAIPLPDDIRGFTFSLRPGAKPEDHVYSSGAPLTSETHLSYLNELVSLLQER
jgi:hypothetical protein